MGWDLVGELRQLSHDIVVVSPQTDAIKAKHPAILDAAARRIVVLEEEVERLEGLIRRVIQGKWSITDLQEAIGDV